MKKLVSALTVIATSYLASCGTSSSDNSGGGDADGDSKVSINLMSLNVPTNLTRESRLRAALTGSKSGYNTPDQLESLVYAFDTISMCENVKGRSDSDGIVTAFGFDELVNCQELYANPDRVIGGTLGKTPEEILDLYFGADNQTFDLIDESDIAELNKVESTLTAGSSYQYMVVTWPSMIGVKGSVSIGAESDVTLRTKQPASYETGGWQTVTKVADMSSGSSELSYVQSANGGMVSRFGAPVTIEENVEYKMQIILNTEAALVGCNTSSAAGNITDETNEIQVPMLPITAALLKADDALVRESYVAQGIGDATDFVLRTDVYYAQSDASKTPINVSVTGFGKSNDNCYLNGYNRVLRIEKQSDDTYSFYSTDTTDGLQLSGFTVGGTTMKIYPMAAEVSTLAGLNGLPDSVPSEGLELTGMTCSRQIVGSSTSTSCE